MIPACVAQAARDPKIRGSTLSVYIVLFEYLSFWEFRSAKLTSIGRQIGVKKPNVSRAITALARSGYLVRGHGLGSLKTYRLEASPKPAVITDATTRAA